MTDTVRSCWTMLGMAWRQSPVKTAVSVVLMLLNAVALPLLALALQRTADAVVARDTAGATTAGLAVAVLAICALTLGHFAHIAYYELSEINILEFDRELIDLANGSAGLEHHERPEYADKMGVLKEELQRLGWGMYGLLSVVSLALAMVVTGLLLALAHPALLLLPLAAIPPLVTSRRAQRVLDRARDAAAPASREGRHLFRLATGAGPAKELRVFRLQREVLRRHETAWDRAATRMWRAEKRALLLTAGGQLVFSAAYIGAVLLVVRQVVAGRGTVGDVVLVITLASQVNQQVTQAVTLLRELQRMAEALTRLRWLRDLVARQAPPPPDADVPPVLRDGIELRGVAFGYPGGGRPVLSGVDLRLPAGSTVALVGENGAGKTTLVKLLCRFHDTTEGTVTVDGTDLRRMPVEDWRSRIAAGFQDFVRFELPAGRAVGVGDLPALDDGAAVTAALGRAGAADVLDRLPDGLATPLGKSYTDGAELSGGQWQKLALGRAMMREEPLLLVLDEPTSALDAEAEHRLFERYARNARRAGRRTGAVTLFVTHRFSTARSADLVVVVADGGIAEAGSHTELLARGGLYAELYTLQAAAYRRGGTGASPGTGVPGTEVPDTEVPDTEAPDSAVPDTTAPDTTAPGTTAPGTAAPDGAPADPRPSQV
ncbi:ABC transporter ATP-binding protein [Streptomyces sp. Ru87]|uniref:ABC transporter ATP-binding protein n=1 Tax=Streptomyces sp. Ru87 TaxID=2044307 RepID=UPI000BF5465B|nr:ABC transporter ATP-binding protein [Streptomyces sp. Ru87]PGH51981.1 ABC transporter permease [Streptomyces sp. Ru87]